MLSNHTDDSRDPMFEGMEASPMKRKRRCQQTSKKVLLLTRSHGKIASTSTVLSWDVKKSRLECDSAVAILAPIFGEQKNIALRRWFDTIILALTTGKILRPKIFLPKI